MSCLYICYLSLLDPLTQSQVVAYLEGLSQAGYRIVLLTFEPRRLSQSEETEWRNRLLQQGIIWHWVRYHKKPSALATAWDIAVGIGVGLRLIQKYGVKLIHARNHVPGVMALILKRLTHIKILFDCRGIMAEEYVDAHHWRAGSYLVSLTKKVERALVRESHAVIVLTARARSIFQEWYPKELNGKSIHIIPCCVDMERFPIVKRQNPKPKSKCIAYVGKLGGWYLEAEMASFISVAMKELPELRWTIWTQSDSESLMPLFKEHEISNRVSVGNTPPEALAEQLSHADGGLSFIKPCFSKLCSSPTKVAEYLAAGIPVISTRNIGDLDEILKTVGVFVQDFTRESYREAVLQLGELWKDPSTEDRCRRVAREKFDLKTVGWKRYREVYAEFSVRE